MEDKCREYVHSVCDDFKWVWPWSCALIVWYRELYYRKYTYFVLVVLVIKSVVTFTFWNIVTKLTFEREIQSMCELTSSWYLLFNLLKKWFIEFCWLHKEECSGGSYFNLHKQGYKYHSPPYRSSEGKALEMAVQQCSLPPTGDDSLASVQLTKNPYRSSWGDQFSAMFRRSAYEIIRNPAVTIIKIATSVVSLMHYVFLHY